MSTAVNLIRALAGNALDDSVAERQQARDATVRADAYLDKHHELMALAERIVADERAAKEDACRIDDEIAAMFTQHRRAGPVLDSDLIDNILHAQIPGDSELNKIA